MSRHQVLAALNASAEALSRVINDIAQVSISAQKAVIKAFEMATNTFNLSSPNPDNIYLDPDIYYVDNLNRAVTHLAQASYSAEGLAKTFASSRDAVKQELNSCRKSPTERQA
ncbi:MAG: hypothetical protein ACFB2W_00565 [Leptolyngbyaceae cyanobacterium]